MAHPTISAVLDAGGRFGPLRTGEVPLPVSGSWLRDRNRELTLAYPWSSILAQKTQLLD